MNLKERIEKEIKGILMNIGSWKGQRDMCQEDTNRYQEFIDQSLAMKSVLEEKLKSIQ